MSNETVETSDTTNVNSNNADAPTTNKDEETSKCKNRTRRKNDAACMGPLEFKRTGDDWENKSDEILNRFMLMNARFSRTSMMVCMKIKMISTNATKEKR